MNTLQLSNIDIIALFNMLFVSPNVFCVIFFFWSGMQYRITCGICLISLFSFNLTHFLAFLGFSWPWHFRRAEASCTEKGPWVWVCLPVSLLTAFRLWVWAEEPVSDVLSVHQLRRHFVIICSIVWGTYFDYLVRLVFSRAAHCQGTIFLPLAVYNWSMLLLFSL